MSGNDGRDWLERLRDEVLGETDRTVATEPLTIAEGARVTDGFDGPEIGHVVSSSVDGDATLCRIQIDPEHVASIGARIRRGLIDEVAPGRGGAVSLRGRQEREG